ncbi:MAG TPA: DUF3310 domain-containing protein [Luteibaculaceae bacterium]|nr:DUF3310 domain-containing protein [Luteibaculaceae bacterium]
MIKANEIPPFVKELMLKRQEEQGNPRDWSVFERSLKINKKSGGFDWYLTPERDVWHEAIWHEAIEKGNFQPLYDFHGYNPEADPVEKSPDTPAHYQNGKIQPIDFIADQGLDFLEGNVVKYICRYKQKDGIKDLLKAKDYLQRIIDNFNQKSPQKDV